MLRVFPVARSGRPTFTDDFGAPRGTRKHQGTDIFAAAGTLVFAVDEGSARKADDPKGGQVVYLSTSDGGHYYYAHLQSYEGSFPRKVRAGEPIGRVGTTGNATGLLPHLHFEVHQPDGTAVDPFEELKSVPPSDPVGPQPIITESPTLATASSGASAGAGFLLLLLLWSQRNTRRVRT